MRALPLLESARGAAGPGAAQPPPVVSVLTNLPQWKFLFAIFFSCWVPLSFDY